MTSNYEIHDVCHEVIWFWTVRELDLSLIDKVGQSVLDKMKCSSMDPMDKSLPSYDVRLLK